MEDHVKLNEKTCIETSIMTGPKEVFVRRHCEGVSVRHPDAAPVSSGQGFGLNPPGRQYGKPCWLLVNEQDCVTLTHVELMRPC